MAFGGDVGRLAKEDQMKLVFEMPRDKVRNASDVMLALEYFEPARGILPIAFEEVILSGSTR